MNTNFEQIMKRHYDFFITLRKGEKVGKINGINGHSNITAYLKDKISRYETEEKSFENFSKLF